MRFEILSRLPPYGPVAINFSARRAREHREGLVVRFHPDRSEPWIGNFVGGGARCTTALAHPNETDVIVVIDGDACVIDLDSRMVRDRIGAGIEEVIRVPELGCVVFRSLVDFAGITATGNWQSPRVSWDGFRGIEVRSTTLVGNAWTPISEGWVPFELDLLTGHCAGGIYEQDMARAVPVPRR